MRRSCGASPRRTLVSRRLTPSHERGCRTRSRLRARCSRFGCFHSSSRGVLVSAGLPSVLLSSRALETLPALLAPYPRSTFGDRTWARGSEIASPEDPARPRCRRLTGRRRDDLERLSLKAEQLPVLIASMFLRGCRNCRIGRPMACGRRARRGVARHRRTRNAGPPVRRAREFSAASQTT